MGRKLREGEQAGTPPDGTVPPLPLDRPAEEEGKETDVSDLVAMAEYISTCRRLRDEMFGVDFFGDPAWDILLDLYIGQTEKRVLPGRKVSWNTTQRWKNVLEAEGLVSRNTDREGLGPDIVLTAKGTALMHDYLKRAARIA